MSNPLFNTPVINAFHLTDVGANASPTFVDIDGDGDLDVFIGNYLGNSLFYRNTGTVHSAVFAAPITNAFGLKDVGGSANPVFVDIDGDGDKDAFIGNNKGNTLFYRNTGTANNPVFAAAVTNPFGLTRAGYFSSPTFVDIDGDGDKDAFVGNWDGKTLFYRNTGNASHPVFAPPSTNALGLTSVGSYASPTFADIDGDGDLDAFIGNYKGEFTFYRNTGNASHAVFAAPVKNPFDLIKGAYKTAPVFADIDGDGDIDMLAGTIFGSTLFYVNTPPTPQNDILNGTVGNDVIDGLAGADTMTGGLGNDSYYVDNSGDKVIETSVVGAGIDSVYSTINYTLGANVERLILIGTAAINGTGNTLNNTLTGNVKANVLTGGLGNDVYYVGAGDKVIETSALATEIDTVNSTVNFTLGAHIEKLTLIGTAAINGMGNTLNNVLTGNSAANSLNGGSGNDTMTGGLGNDSYYVGTSGDKVIETSTLATEIDTVYSSIAYTLGANVEKLTLIGSAAINGIGNTLANTLTGNAGVNVLKGGAGNDTYNIGAGDSVLETSTLATEIDTVHSSVTHTLEANVENLTLTGSAAINGVGNGLNNLLIGNNAANTLTGNNGADTLLGGLGKDSINLVETVAATDTVRFAATDSLPSAYDVITSFKLGKGTINTAGVDKLDVVSTHIAANAVAVNGVDAGVIHSHHVSNGMISFDDVNSYTAPLAVTATNLASVLNYLKANIGGSNTVAFVSGGNSFVFQDGGVNDTVVELLGVTAHSVSSSGVAAGAVWIA